MNNIKLDASDLKKSLESHFDDFEAGLNGKSNQAIHQLRRKAMEAFKKLGFPNTKNEEWKYTNVAKVLKQEYVFNPTSSIQSSEIQDLLFQGEEAYVLVIVNGQLNQELSTLPEDNLQILDLEEAYEKHADTIDQFFAQHTNIQEEAFTALNTAFTQSGVFVQVPDNQVIDKPVMIYYMADGRQENVVIQPRVLITVGKNSQITFLDKTDTIGQGYSFNNLVNEIYVEENAHVKHFKIQDDTENSFYVGTTQVYQHKNSVYTNVTVSLKGGLIRNNLNIKLDGEHIESNMYGLYMLDGKTHVDNHSIADHQQPNSVSNELYKGIMDDHSVGVFNGKIYVRQVAQKTNAYQQNRNILLSDNASINTKPQLEIWADDVKCSHGATTGSLDETALFYLRSRGISAVEARALLIQAFANEIIQMISLETVQNYLMDIIVKRLRQEKP